MFITDPDQPQDDTTADPADAAAETLTDNPMAAMDAGIASVTESEQEPEADPPEGETAPGGATPAETAPTEDAKPSAEFGELPKDTKAETRERFDKLRGAYDELHKEVAPLREALKAAGIEDLAKLPDVIQRAKVGEDMVQMVMDTGATSEQYGLTLDYLTLVNKAIQGDLQAGEKAWALMQQEMAPLAKLLGKDVAGADPLADYPDLLEKIEAGDTTRELALEVARARNADNLRTAAAKQAETANDTQAITAQATEWVKGFDAHMLANDPTYAAKRPMLDVQVRFIRANLPPKAWPEAIKQAYAAIPTPAAPAAPVATKPAGQPVRPSGPRPTLAPQTDDPMEALNFGVAQASGL